MEARVFLMERLRVCGHLFVYGAAGGINVCPANLTKSKYCAIGATSEPLSARPKNGESTLSAIVSG